MTLDIRGSIKNTKLSSNPYVVFEELISNAIDAFLIRKHADVFAGDMQVKIEVEFDRKDLLDDENMTVFCRDNGCGLGDDQLKAFLTKDTSYKDDLSISGIGSCKGAGRIQFFHHFSSISIDSVYRKGDTFISLKMKYCEPTKQIDSEDFTRGIGSAGEIGTAISLKGFKEIAFNRVAQGQKLSTFFSASILKKQMLIAFLQRLVGLDNQLGDFEISFTTHHWKNGKQSDSLTRSDLPTVTAERKVKVEEIDSATGKGVGRYQEFKLFHYRLDASEYGLPRNAIAFCAKSSPVKDITHRYLRTRSQQNNPVAGFNHIVIIESNYLDQRVNEQRDDFENIPTEIVVGDLFPDATLSYATIYDVIDPVIEEMVVPGDWNKDDVIKDITNRFGISEAMLQDTSTRIVYGETPQAVAERVLKKYQERVIKETDDIINLKEEIVKAEPDSDRFRSLINDLSWKYTSSLKSVDMANLSQLIVRRTAIVQILDLARQKKLAIQAVDDGTRRKDERIIHSIFFPMRKDTDKVLDHDIWLLSEEYQYYDYIASDLPLADVTWDGGKKVFESDIDIEIQKILEKRAMENGGKRPDIAIFSKEGSAIIIEFKAPGVSLDDYIGDLQEYSHLLAAKSRGKLKKIYGYLIGDTLNALRLPGQWTPFPLGDGYFQSSTLLDPKTRTPLGETYFEIMYFTDVIERAKKRIEIYRNKLQLKIDFH
ncbi:MAG TPA: hypothetical protein VHC91_20455 [Trinickia sp.]|uniref:hypothetical protein n=1 Tax=Trinickia sp. TaxID=2571163 RepID=UPI002BA2A9A8|nr:hypothetical protein [Trinickia sp.]HVW52732.1 hypothetical protein [Trinickia sp.]